MHGRFEPLKISDFRNYLGTRFFFTIAYQMQAVLLAMQIYEMTLQPLSLGLSGLAEALPAIGMALIAGNVADRSNKNKLVMYAVMGLAFSALLSFLYVSYGTAYFQSFGPLPLYGAIAISGLSRAFLGPSNFSIMTKIVPKNLYLAAGPLDSGLWQLAAVSGPAIGGFLYGWIGIKSAMILVLVFFVLSLLFLLRVKTVVSGNKSTKLFDRQEFFKGLNFIFSQKLIFSALTLDMFAVLFGGAVALLPVVASDILHVGPEGLGLLRAAPAVGSALMGIMLTFLPPMRYGGRLMIICVIGFGLSIFVFAFSKSMWLSWTMLFLTGAFDNISVVVRSAIMQIFTPEELRGRTASVRSMFIISSNEIGAFESGVAAHFMGTVPSIAFGGIMSVAIALLAVWKARELWHLNFRELGQD